jgi:hypothetical protein
MAETGRKGEKRRIEAMAAKEGKSTVSKAAAKAEAKAGRKKGKKARKSGSWD